MPRRERDDQVAMVNGTYVRQDHQAAIPIARQGLDGVLDLTDLADGRLDRFDVKGRSRVLDRLPEQPGERRRVRIEHEGDPSQAGRDLLEHCQPFGPHGGFERGEPGDVAARTRQACYETLTDRIDHLHEHGRHGVPPCRKAATTGVLWARIRSSPALTISAA